MEVLILEMGIIIAWEKIGYVSFLECDGQKCAKKIKHTDQQMLLALADLSGWKNIGYRWLCPFCAREPSEHHP